jgi:HSP20 family protein
MDIIEREDGFYLYLELPGVNKEDLKVEIRGNELIVEAYTTYGLDDSERLHNLEFADVHYQGKYNLFEGIDRNAISAELRHGVLTVLMPRRAKEPHRIVIKVK